MTQGFTNSDQYKHWEEEYKKYSWFHERFPENKLFKIRKLHYLNKIRRCNILLAA